MSFLRGHLETFSQGELLDLGHGGFLLAMPTPSKLPAPQILNEILNTLKTWLPHTPLNLFVPPKNTQNDYKIRFFASRIALYELLKNMPTNSASCAISIAHTHGFSIAAAKAIQRLPHHSFNAGLGVDVELLDRKISQKVFMRLTTPQEREIKTLKALDFWCLKEASLKADSRTNGALLSDFHVQSFCSESKIAKLFNIKKQASFEATIFNKNKYLIAASHSGSFNERKD
jgi:phosphopantetheinyl transferase (holo-ACP synthase)